MQPTPFVTEQEYLTADRAATERSEYLNGLVVPKASGSINHARIVGNCAILLQSLLPDTCEAFACILRVQAKRARCFFYPDIFAVSAPIECSDEFQDTVTNPTLVVEVLSPSSASYDLDEKFRYYRTIDTLQQYTVLWETEARAETYARQENGWLITEISGLDTILPVPSLQCELPLQDLYRRVVFPTAEPER